MTKFLNISTDSTLAGNSDETVVSQKAIKAYADTKAPLDTYLAPNFDGLTPIATYEFDTSSTSFYKLLTFNNIYATTEDIPVAHALFRITTTIGGKTSIIDAIVETQKALSYMRILSNHTTGYTSSSNTGIRYIRSAVPKALNDGNDWELDISAHNSTARHIKVEVFQSDNGFTWFANGSVSTITTSTHSNTTITYYATQGTIIHPSINVTASNAASATFISSRLPKLLPGTMPLAAEALLVYQICFFSGNNIYPSTNTNVAINTDVGLMATYANIAADAAPAYYNINQKEPIANLDAVPHATLTRGDPCYFRCTMDANGNIKSDNYVATAMTAGYTWCYIGIASSATAIMFDTTNSVFLTLDANGKISHVNGKRISGGGAVDSVNGKTGVVVLDASDVGAATAAQGALADTAVQPAALNDKVDKVSTASKIYGTTSSGAQTAYSLASNATASTIAYRTTGGVLSVGTPTSDAHAATKKYVDNLIPTVNNPTITITQGGVTKGSFTLNQATGDTIALDAGGGGSSNIPYGTSDSATDATEKTVSIPEITALNVGQIIIVQPSITSSVANSTLKLNNFPAYPMIYVGAAITTSTDSYVWNASFPTMWRFDGTNWVFLAHGIDYNTTYTSMNAISDNGQYTSGSGTYAITRYSLIMQKADMTWEKITATNANYTTATTKTVNTNGFRLNQIRYYSTTTGLANGALSATNVVLSQAASVDMRYSTNCGGTTTWALGDYIYLVGTLGLDGLFYLDTTTWWTNTLPNTKDGKLYIRLGLALADNGYTMSFFADRPIFYHDGTSIREYNPAQGYHPDLFDHKWADHILNDAQWLRADTFSWQSGAVYQAAYQHLADDITGKTLQSETIGSTTVQFYLADDGHKICPDTEESNVAAIYTATGVAWYYIIDTTNQRFKLPRTKYGFSGLRSNVGDYVPESLPNLTGTFGKTEFNTQNYPAVATGVFSYRDLTRSTPGSGDKNDVGYVDFNANSYSSTYQDNAPVQERSTEMYLYFYVGNFTQTAIENTAGLNAELFNDKADVDSVVALTSSWGFPSDTEDTLTLGASGTTYTAPDDGWFCLYAEYNSGSNAFFDMYITGTSMGGRHFFSTNATQAAGRCCVPVRKTQSLTVDINGTLKNVYFTFVHAKKTN